ncbi:PorT family protein [Chitinophaga silvatica]|uniref:PorT family protein n=1 Tax=Chitinophaga silvatica TaxID=2282649 RepID=A0A3E1YG51_9BACT|nr:porin family protein [Chitinophaga silvatica]RFS26359.1 PorT family protein [Chitinophaga silvatica]
MKKLLSVFLLFSFISVHAQRTIHYGVKFDGGLYKLDGEGIQSKYTLGGQIGVFGYRDFSSRWGFASELMVSQANPKKAGDFAAKYIYTSNSMANTSIRLNYLTIPLLIRYNINQIVSLNAGPQYSFLFFEDENLLTYNRVAFKRSDFAAAAGFTLTFDKLHVFGRYLWGLSDINNIDDRYKWKSQQAQLGLGFNIR